MDHSDIRERLSFLQIHLSRLRAANEVYLKKRCHAPAEVEAHRQRQERLHKILDELSEISKGIKAA